MEPLGGKKYVAGADAGVSSTKPQELSSAKKDVTDDKVVKDKLLGNSMRKGTSKLTGKHWPETGTKTGKKTP